MGHVSLCLVTLSPMPFSWQNLEWERIVQAESSILALWLSQTPVCVISPYCCPKSSSQPSVIMKGLHPWQADFIQTSAWKQGAAMCLCLLMIVSFWNPVPKASPLSSLSSYSYIKLQFLFCLGFPSCPHGNESPFPSGFESEISCAIILTTYFSMTVCHGHLVNTNRVTS